MQGLVAPRGDPFGMSAGANCENFAGAHPIEREFHLDNLGVRVSLHALTDGGNRIVHSRPATNGGFEDRTQCVGKGEIAAV